LPFRKKKDSGIDYKRSLAVTSEQYSPTDSEKDYEFVLGKLQAMLKDENVDAVLKDSILEDFIFITSHVNSTINLDKKQAELKRLRLEQFVILKKLTMSQDDYESNGLESLMALRMYCHDRINETVNGWKGHLVTEQVKVIETKEAK
jgi:predicted nucleotidyltransferase